MPDDIRHVSKRFSHRLHLVLISAAQLATQQGKKAIAPSHLLYGLVGQQEFLISQFFPPTPVKDQKSKGDEKSPKSAEKKTADKDGVALTVSSQRILQYATKIANCYQHSSIDILHLFASLLHYPNPDLTKILAKKKIAPQELEGHIMAWLEDLHSLSPLIDALHPGQQQEKQEKEGVNQRKAQSALQVFATHLTNDSYATKLDPLIGRERELSRLTTILARRTKNNPLLLGEPGVGKTAIVEGLARKILLGDVPATLLNKKIYSLNLTTMIAGTTFRGELEARFKHLLDEISQRDDVILFIDEIHTMVGAGASAGSAMDVGNILKPALARGLLRCIGATTFGEYKKHIEDDPALERRFQSITVDQPSAEETERIIIGIAPNYEQFHNISISPEAIHAAVTMGQRYLPERYFPDKAIDLIDEAAAFARTNTQPTLNISALESAIRQPALLQPSHIAQVVSHSTGIPLSALLQNDKERSRNLETTLSNHIVGQDHAKRIVAKALQRAQCGLTPPGRPLASFAFLGPSGVGKTELAKAIAQEVFGPGALIKLDMSEFSESFTISRLLGAPNGYVGFKEGGKLTEAVRRRPHSIVVFDEIEKAHPKVANILLQLLEDGRLTDATGKIVDFSNTVIILTSNLGAKFAQGQPSLGFGLTDTAGTLAATKEKLIGEMKQWFSPELVNRLDQVVVFNELTSEDLTLIIKQKITELQTRLTAQRITLRVTPRAQAALAKKISEQGQGARAVRHLIEQTVESAIADTLITINESPPHHATLDVGTDGLIICRIKSPS